MRQVAQLGQVAQDQEEEKHVREKSRECHNHKPQPFPDTKRKRKQTKLNKHKSNKHMKSTMISSLFPKQGNRNAKKTEKTQEQNNTRQDLKQSILMEDVGPIKVCIMSVYLRSGESILIDNVGLIKVFILVCVFDQM